MNIMIKPAITVMGSIFLLSLFFFSGCSQDINNFQNKENICEINKEYKHTAVNPINCTCPEGYDFEIISGGWGPCPGENMTDCPMSIMKCVQGEL